jgi:Flp pilus assembly protein TadB
MFTRAQWRRFIDHPVTEWAAFAVGLVLLIVSPLVGALPGPGGIVVAGIGLALVLRTSMWAKRRYVRFKRWQPKAGRWMDWALRRRSAERRETLRKASESAPGN